MGNLLENTSALALPNVETQQEAEAHRIPRTLQDFSLTKTSIVWENSPISHCSASTGLDVASAMLLWSDYLRQMHLRAWQILLMFGCHFRRKHRPHRKTVSEHCKGFHKAFIWNLHCRCKVNITDNIYRQIREKSKEMARFQTRFPTKISTTQEN